MSGFESRSRDVINQAAPTYATVSVAHRGLSHFVDPSMTGQVRFMARAGYPFPLLTPQMTSELAVTATAGSKIAQLSGLRLKPWLIAGSIVSFELVETTVVESVAELENGNLLLSLRETITGEHTAGTRVYLRGFSANPNEATVAGQGGLGNSPFPILTPFILVPGDAIVVEGTKFVIQTAVEISSTPIGFVYDVSVTNPDGIPATGTSTDIMVMAKAAYRSGILNVPHTASRSKIVGPVAIDVVSGPVVVDYTPKPESRIFVEEFDSSSNLIAVQREIKKNDTLARFSITRDQMLFWKAAEGGVNWNGTYVQLKAYESGRAHLWTATRPPLDAIPFVTKAATVASFPPYAVLLTTNIRSAGTSVIDALTRAQIPEADYSINEATGAVSFGAAYAGRAVVITYQPRLEWQLFARALEDNIELTVTTGREPKQVFNLGPAGTPHVLTVQTLSSNDLDQLHITARRQNDGAGPFVVELGDWTPRGPQTAAVRYVISTDADLDYEWAASGLLFKAIWPNLEILRARLDGESLFAQYLDNGRLVL